VLSSAKNEMYFLQQFQLKRFILPIISTGMNHVCSIRNEKKKKNKIFLVQIKIKGNENTNYRTEHHPLFPHRYGVVQAH
jgi:hypothetical protein